MRKVLIPAAALLLCATPAAAQQLTAQAEPEAAAPAAQRTAEPSLYPTTDQVKAEVRANEQRTGHDQAPLGSKDWWYLVAAVAIGVIIAALVL